MTFLNKINTKQICLLQVLPHLNSGGMISGAIEISNFLKKNGGTSIIVSSGGFRENEVLRNNASLIHLPVETKNPFYIYKNKIQLIKIIKKFNVNIIHARSRAPAWSSYWASKFTKTPFINSFCKVSTKDSDSFNFSLLFIKISENKNNSNSLDLSLNFIIAYGVPFALFFS